MKDNITDDEDESGVPPHIKVLIFAGILCALGLLVFGGIAAILASKYSKKNNSTPSTDPYTYYNSPPIMMKSSEPPELINEAPLEVERIPPSRITDLEKIEIEKPRDFERIETIKPKSK